MTLIENIRRKAVVDIDNNLNEGKSEAWITYYIMRKYGLTPAFVEKTIRLYDEVKAEEYDKLMKR